MHGTYGILLTWLCLGSLTCVAGAEDWKPAEGRLLTRWAKDVTPDNVLPEHPRPQMVRPDWLNLNGLWDYAITPAERAEVPTAHDGQILVPFCVESALSGVQKAVGPGQALWYQRTFEIPADWRGRRVLLHFGAVDWTAHIWVNGQHLGSHQGGYDAFSFDVTNALTPSGPQTLVVKVTDPTDQNWQPRGKQVLEPKGIWYTAVTGIWQTVWLEPVPEQHIRTLSITPNVDRSEVLVAAEAPDDGRTHVDVLEDGRVIASGEAAAGQAAAIQIPSPKLWSPDSPHLYDLKVSLLDGDAEVDAVQSYFGMRKIALGQYNGYTRLMLNDKPLFQFGPLDQGWWPDGLYTAPTDDALRYDVEVLKKLGMNMLRKHVKVEPDRLYYHCDRLGLLVWQDMPSGDKYIGGDDPDIKREPASAANFEREFRAMIDGLRNHPSIVMWVVYNEGWGQWDTKRMAEWTRTYDRTRLVDSVSGWADRGVGDVIDVHSYPGPGMRPAEEHRASVLGEFGGLGWPVEGHLWWNKKNWGYRTYTSQAELQENYLSVVRRLLPLIGQGLSAAVYTQTSDVEGEVNGLMTYDREVLKYDAATLAGLHRQLYLPPPEVREVVPTSLQTPQAWRYALEQPADDWMKPGFDDSSWSTGQGMFGKEGTPGVRVGTAWTTSDIWLRREVTLNEVPAGDLRLNIYHDEDAEVYINGVLAAEVKGYVTAHVLLEMTPEARAALKAGRNTFAVHCHQTGGGQGIDMGLSLVVQRADDYPIQPVPFADVSVEGGFWEPRLETNRTVTVWSNFHKCEETGRLSNFAKAGGRLEGGFEGIFFNDSDVYKVIEGASYTLVQHPDAKLDRYLDDLIADIAAAQEDDGYLYTARTINDPKYDYPGKEGRWTHLAHGHELYNVGHLYEAAVAHFLATGKRTLLDVAIKNADLIARTFGPGPGQRVDVPGHEGIEIGLVKLYRVTGERKYRDLARFFIDMRGRQDKRKQLYGDYCQDHKPVVEQSEAVGHAVRAGYLYSGVADVAALTGDEQYIAALDRIWSNVVEKKLYLTGGIGARRAGEAFGDDYELPNGTAYNETCAAIANALWNHRMFLLHGDAKYVDVLERVIYNGFLAGISLSGDTFFYPNPLSCDGHYPFNQGNLERSKWFGCSCCPVNIVRFIPSIAGMIYAQRDDVGYVNLYISGHGTLQLNGTNVQLAQNTDYPWDGDVRISVQPEHAGEFELRLRIPGWARGRPMPGDLYRYLDDAGEAVTLSVNGKPAALKMADGFAVLRREWSPGDTIDLHLPMPVHRVACNENVPANRGRVALERGPVVYCIEGADHEGRALNVALPDVAEISLERCPDLLGGITVLHGVAEAVNRDESGERAISEINLTAIPYHAWCHRGANEMTVWMPRDIIDVPTPSLAAAFHAEASYCYRSDTVTALNDGLLATSSSDQGLPRMTWWDHKGTAEWLQYDLPRLMDVDSVDVYWFDDTGMGQCRVPQSWRLLYRDGDTWRSVASPPGDFGVAKDRFNKVSFDPVRTNALRLEVQLQPDFSGGVLEWRVNPP